MFIKVIRLIERWSNGEKNYYLHEVSLNTNHIAFLSENVEIKSILMEGKLNIDLNKKADFTDIKLSSGKEIIVVGSASVIESKIINSGKKILRG